MEAIAKDLQYAARNLRRSPAFTVLVVSILVFGIGAGTVVFSLVKGVLLDPLEFPRAERLVFVRETAADGTQAIAYPNFEDWERAQSTLSGLAAYAERTMTLDGSEGPSRVQGVRVTGKLFEVLGVSAAVGRVLGPADDRLDADPAVVISHGLWKERFAGDRGVVGTRLRLDARSYTVVGVAPEGFSYPFFGPVTRADVWVPMGLFTEEWPMWHRADHPGIYGVGRLREDASLAAARNDLGAIAAALEDEYPETNSGTGVELLSLKEFVVGDARPALLTLLAGVSFMLLIVCANTASLLLVRATGRRRELAVRAAIGASGGRLLRLLLGEGLLLGLAGGAGGTLLAGAALDVIARSGAAGLPRIAEAGVDPAVLTFALMLTLLVGGAAGALPGLQWSRPDLQAELKGGRSTESGGRTKLRGALVLAEVVLATVLLVGAGITGRSLLRLLSDDPGLDPNGVLTAEIDAADTPYEEAPRMRRLFHDLAQGLESIPGVHAAGTVWPLPLSGSTWGRWYYVEGAPPPDPSRPPTADFAQVSPGALPALGIPILRGRGFTAADTNDGPPVAIVDEQFAARWWPGADPLGKRIQMGGYGSGTPWIEVVGVVPSVKNRGVAGVDREQIYLPVQQETVGLQALVLRTDGDPTTLTAPLRDLLRRLAPEIPLFEVRTLSDYRTERAGQQPLVVTLVVAFAVAGQLLAALGLYGVMAFTVAARYREIGIRMALGARAGDALRMMLSSGLRLVATGLGAGLAIGVAVARVLAGQLYGVDPAEPAVFATVTGVILLVGTAACLAPSLRAAWVDPMVSLRQE